MKIIGIREVLFAILLLGTPLGAWAYAFRPANRSNAEMMKELKSKQGKLNELDKIMSSMGGLEQEIADLEHTIAIFQSQLPSTKEMDTVLRETWRLAEKNGMVTNSIRMVSDKSRNKSFYATSAQSEQRILINISGDFQGFYTFLQALERQPRIMRISRMNVTKNSTDEEEGQVSVDLDISVFFENSGEG